MIGVNHFWRAAPPKLAIASAVSAAIAFALVAIDMESRSLAVIAGAVCLVTSWICAAAQLRAVRLWRRAAEFETERHRLEQLPRRRRGPRGWKEPRSMADLV